MLSYTFFCCACMCGPFFEYRDYINFIEQNEHYYEIPNSLLPSLKRLFQGLCNTIYYHLYFIVCLAINVTVANYFWLDFCGTEDYSQMGFLYKVS